MLNVFKKHITLTARKFLSEQPSGDGIDVSEYESICLESFYKSVLSYVREGDGSFFSYFMEVAYRSMNKYRYENSYLFKAKQFASKYSIDDVAYQNGHILICDIVGEDDDQIYALADSQDIEKIDDKIFDSLTPFQKEVVKLSSSGMRKRIDIAKALNCSVKKVYRADSQIRKIIQDYFDKER